MKREVSRRALSLVTLPHFRLGRRDDREGVEQQQRLVENRPAVGVDVTRHAPVALVMDAQQRPMLIGYAPARVFLERAGAGDFPASTEVVVSVEAGWVIPDGDGDSEFFSVSLSRNIRDRHLT